MLINFRYLILAAGLGGCTGTGTAQLSKSVSPHHVSTPPLTSSYSSQARSITTSVFPKACPDFSVVERSGAPPVTYLGAVPGHPDVCRELIGANPGQYYFGIWGISWPGSASAFKALKSVIYGPPGTTVTFNTIALPGLQWHDTLRNKGVYSLALLGKTYKTIKIEHYRKGYDGNHYESDAIIWKDIRTGMIIYRDYMLISGQPNLTAWDPKAIYENNK